MVRRYKQTRWLSSQSFLVFMKGMAVQILTGVIAIPATLITMWIASNNATIGAVFGAVLAIAYMFTWGWIARKFWGWY